MRSEEKKEEEYIHKLQRKYLREATKLDPFEREFKHLFQTEEEREEKKQRVGAEKVFDRTEKAECPRCKKTMLKINLKRHFERFHSEFVLKVKGKKKKYCVKSG